MLTSVKSNNKDIVALYPVSKLTANDLVHYINLVLKSLHTLGYKCVSVISDNNRVNRKAFKIMCGGTLTSPIQHPSDPNSKLFFLFDTVHLFKYIRNNWLNVKIPPQTFQFPPFDNDHEFYDAHSASFSVLKI